MLFAGWFGPVGIGAFYYSQVSMRHTGIMEIWPVVSLIICMSIFLHGVTATPFTKLYGKHTLQKPEYSKEKTEDQKSRLQNKEHFKVKSLQEVLKR